jgi:uridine monophosphate synthetase
MIAFFLYHRGVYRTADWADIVNTHVVPGGGCIEGLKQGGLSRGRGLLLVAEMSSKGSLATGGYTAAAVAMAEANKDFVIGFICQRAISNDPELLHMTPGVSLATKDDKLGQAYSTPKVIFVSRMTFALFSPNSCDAGVCRYNNRL